MKIGVALEAEYELDEIEKAVLNIAEELSKLPQRIEYRGLYYRAKRALNYSRIDISNAIHKLYLKKYIIVGSCLTKTEVLQNPARNRIYEYIVSHIGAHVREIREKVSITPHILDWHLSILESFDYIYRVSFLKYVTFFPIDFDKNYTFAFLVLKNENALQIFKKILDSPLIKVETLVKDVKLQKNIILYHLDNLLKFGLLCAHEVDGEVVYGINHANIMPIKAFYNLSEEEIQNSRITQQNLTDKLKLKEFNPNKGG
jgi:predicted transcriptional regulator